MWTATAPSNIALIKYMGKDKEGRPCNPSLSYTIDRFFTKVSLKLSSEDSFENSLGLTQNGITRFLSHLRYIKGIFGCYKCFKIKSENNFPHSAGIASSASSFAALTQCSIKAICEIHAIAMPSLEEISAISRKGSGSSCRSFFTPGALWKGDIVKAIDLPNFDYDLILMDASRKKISSSEAHCRVQTSPLFLGRPQRAEARLEQLISAFQSNNWRESYKLCWEEFMDMHSLFETSRPGFSYLTDNTRKLLNIIENFWDEYNDGPLVTIDAGPNVHLLWRKNYQENLRNQFKLLLTNLSKNTSHAKLNLYSIL